MTINVILIILIFTFCSALDFINTGILLIQTNYTACEDVEIYNQRLVCEIHSQEDEIKIERFGLSGCYGSTLSCAEGDIKTCMPLMTLNTLHYQCFCHSEQIANQEHLVSDYYWTDWQKLARHVAGFIYIRKLMINNGTECVAEEYSRTLRVQYIVSDYDLPDSVFSASAVWNNAIDTHGPHRARLDNYTTYGCGWTGARSNPWLKITLPDQYKVMGIYIKQRCDHLQYPTVIDVITSVDDVLWQDVVKGENITSRYSSYDLEGSVSVWFSKAYTTRYWKIYIVEFEWHPAMKCDLIGHVV